MGKKARAKRKNRPKQGMPPGTSHSNDLGFCSDAPDTGDEEHFDKELLRHDIAMIHQWRNYPDSMKEVAQQLQDEIHEKHVGLQGTVTTLKNATAACAAYATTHSSAGRQLPGFEVEHFSAQAKLSKLEKAFQKSEAQLMRVSESAASLAEGLQAVADAVINYSDLTCKLMASAFVNLARMSQQNASMEALHLESTNDSIGALRSGVSDLTGRVQQLKQELQVMQLQGLRARLQPRSRDQSAGTSRPESLWEGSDAGSSVAYTDTELRILGAQEEARKKRGHLVPPRSSYRP